MAEKGKAIPSTPAIHTIEPRDFCLFSTFLHFVRCCKKAILSGIHNAPGKSLGLFAYRTSKGVMLIKSTDALIHFDYSRYFHYYRIRKVLESLI